MAKGLLFASFDFSGAHEDGRFHDWRATWSMSRSASARARVPRLRALDR